MELNRKVAHSKISTAGPVDLQLILSPINIKIKIQLIQQIYDVLEVI